MKKFSRILPFLIILFLFGLTGCSSSSGEAKKSDSSHSAKSTSNSGEMSFSENKDQKTDQIKLEVPSQMVIYQADLQLEVKNYEKSIELFEQKVQRYGGYIAESNVRKEGKEQVSGNIKVRIPQKNFQVFLREAESQASEVIQRNITGQDVTEEYVDLNSRLKSKKVVEERLISFMKGAAKTEDLLKISSDLAAVQEEIETIEGKMKFLENQTSLSTINITLYENKVIVPNLKKDDNTWDRTKKQFMKSTNAIITALSSLVVFFVGNLPILLILSIIGYLIYHYFRKVKKGNKGE